MSLAACSHPVVYQGLCAVCRADVSLAAAAGGSAAAGARAGSSAAASPHAAGGFGSQAIVLGSAHKTIHLSASAFADRSASNSVELLSQRRLLAVLDLDHTLLHATSDGRVERFVGREEDLFRITLAGGGAGPAGKTHFVKLRPGLAAFLDALALSFDAHVYTMGARPYADAVVALLDPQHKIIKHRIVSRDEGGAGHAASSPAAAAAAAAHTAKSLRRMYPCDEALIAIIDDRTDVWADNAKNVVRAFEYLYFSGRGEMNSRPQQLAQQQRGNSQALQQRSQSHAQESFPSEARLEPIRSKPAPLPSRIAAAVPASKLLSAAAAAASSSATAAVAPVPSLSSSSGIRRRKTSSISSVGVEMKLSASAPAAAASASTARPAAASASSPIVIDEAGEDAMRSFPPPLAAAASSSSASAAAASPIVIDDEDEPIDHPPESELLPFTAGAPSAAAQLNSATSRLVQDAIASGQPSEGLLAPNVELHQTEVNRILDAISRHPLQQPLLESSLLGRFARRFQSQIERAPQLNNALSKHLASTPYAADPATLPIFPYQFCNHPFPDNVLVSLTSVLQAIHTLFYRNIDQALAASEEAPAAEHKSQANRLSSLLPLTPKLSVPRLITLLKQTTLAGCVIVFSGVYPTVKNNDGSSVQGGAQRAEAWIQATAFGAVCLEDFPGREESKMTDEDSSIPRFGQDSAAVAAPPPRITHVVAARDGSAKLHYAATLPAEDRPHCVHVTWLWHSMAHFQRGDESLFPLWSESKKAAVGSTPPSAVAAGAEATAAPAVAAAAQPVAPSNDLPAAAAAAAVPVSASAPESSLAAPAASSSVAAASSTPIGAGGIRRRFPKKAASVAAAAPAAAAASSAAPAASASPAAPAAAAASSAAASSSSAVVGAAAGVASAPAHSYHLVHHVRSPPTAGALVDRVMDRLRAEEDKTRATEALADMTLAREMVKVAHFREVRSARLSGGAAAAAAASSRSPNKSVRFGGEIGPSNPRFASDTHTEGDFTSAAAGPAPKRKQMLTVGPLDDIERAHKERKLGHPRAAGAAATDRDSLEDVLDLSDDDFSGAEVETVPATGDDDGAADAIDFSDDLFADEGDYGEQGDAFDDDS